MQQLAQHLQESNAAWLKSASEEWRLQIRANRIDVLWRRTDVPETSKGEFAVRAVDLLRTYCALVPTAEIRRIAFVVHRFAKVEQPSTELARYFARRELLDGPLNRPTELQLHAHKVYQPSGMPELNSWVRWRTGTLKNSSTPVVTVEQDLNTPADRTDQFTFDDVERFLARAHGETDSILDHYLAFQSN